MVDQRYIPNRINAVSEAVTIDSIRQHIIDGNAYRVWDTSLNVAVDGSQNFAFITCANKTNKVKFYVECDQSCNLKIIEDASWNYRGDEITGYNFNRSSANTMTCKLYKAPNMAGKWGSGTIISSKWAFALNISGGQARTAFGANSDEYSMILAPSKLYVFSIQNKGLYPINLATHMRITQGTV